MALSSSGSTEAAGGLTGGGDMTIARLGIRSGVMSILVWGPVMLGLQARAGITDDDDVAFTDAVGSI